MTSPRATRSFSLRRLRFSHVRCRRSLGSPDYRSGEHDGAEAVFPNIRSNSNAVLGVIDEGPVKPDDAHDPFRSQSQAAEAHMLRRRTRVRPVANLVTSQPAVCSARNRPDRQGSRRGCCIVSRRHPSSACGAPRGWRLYCAAGLVAVLRRNAARCYGEFDSRVLKLLAMRYKPAH